MGAVAVVPAMTMTEMVLVVERVVLESFHTVVVVLPVAVVERLMLVVVAEVEVVVETMLHLDEEVVVVVVAAAVAREEQSWSLKSEEGVAVDSVVVVVALKTTVE